MPVFLLSGESGDSARPGVGVNTWMWVLGRNDLSVFEMKILNV